MIRAIASVSSSERASTAPVPGARERASVVRKRLARDGQRAGRSALQGQRGADHRRGPERPAYPHGAALPCPDPRRSVSGARRSPPAMGRPARLGESDCRGVDLGLPGARFISPRTPLPRTGAGLARRPDWRPRQHWNATGALLALWRGLDLFMGGSTGRWTGGLAVFQLGMEFAMTPDRGLPSRPPTNNPEPKKGGDIATSTRLHRSF